MGVTWHSVCPQQRLSAADGVAVLLDGHLIAVFRTVDGDVYAVGNVDPFSRASVISRGIVGDRAGEPTVASPMHKQVFSLRTGRCLDDLAPERGLPTYAVRLREDMVEVGLP